VIFTFIFLESFASSVNYLLSISFVFFQPFFIVLRFFYYHKFFDFYNVSFFYFIHSYVLQLCNFDDLFFSYPQRFLGVLCYLAHNLHMVIFWSILQSCAHAPMFCGLYVFSNFYNFLLPCLCSFYSLFYSLCFCKMCSFKVVI
jgi:hypothetical protein